MEDYIHHLSTAVSAEFSVLSPREREVLQLLAEGKTTKETAALLCVSVKTVETHRQQIMSKLNIHTIAELIKYAIREGLTSLDG
jgi:DNA-binding NarL/FixJ family response regulator